MTHDALERLKALTAAYALQLPLKVSELEALWSKYLANQGQADIDDVIRYAHTLCGTAGTYGFKSISEISKRMEMALNNYKSQLTFPILNDINSLIDELKQLSMNPPEEIQQIKFELKHKPINDTRIIYLLGKEKNELILQLASLKQLNYVLHAFDNMEDFMQAVFADSPDMLLININLAEQIPTDAIEKFREKIILIVYFGTEDNLQSRLQTVRHGGQALVSYPFELDSLLRTFDNLFQAKISQNERILIVDDSECLAEYYSTLFKQTDLIVETVTNTKEFMNKLREFQPDLILMDVNMPYCNGIELAQIVHQQENLSGIPIIFLSSISEKTKQLEVLSYAGDDFLTKPVEPKHLLASVHNRLMRSRMLRARMMRDSLTNLYNHTMIHHQLERELALADRHGLELCVVVFDIDKFKYVNDTYGHQAGDKILKEFSLFLQLNLRKTDLIGRYGGEEFLVILPNTSLTAAYELIDRLREEFSKTQHIVGKHEIKVTFSGGISSYPVIKASTDLVKAADSALYAAKNSGRNKIIAA